MLTPPATVTLTNPGKTTPVGIFAVISENDPDLPFQLVSAKVDWNDGTQPVAFQEVGTPLTVNAVRGLGLGTFAVKVTGFNNRSPVPDEVMATFIVNIVPPPTVAPPSNLIFGPILPSDNGNPSAQSWIFDTGSDIDILASSVKMLLITTKGERVMQPNYGTRLRRILFDLNLQAIDAIIQQEINQALNANEPRVSVSSLTVSRDPNNRNVTVQAVFQSKLAVQPFQVNLQFSK